MMNVTAELGDLLQDLEGLSDTSDKEAVNRRRQIWSQIVELVGRPSRDVASEITEKLAVSDVTVARWMAGSYAPRAAFLEQLREHFGLATPFEKKGGPSRLMSPDAPVRFAGSFAALRTLDHFFYCLQRAKSSFVFKGMLEFHASHQQKTRSRVVQALENNASLIIYYVFPEDSKAKATFEEMHKIIESDYPSAGATLSERIKGIPVSKKDERMGLGLSFASPFVVLYDKKGREEFGRAVDIWYEIPVEPVNANNEVDDDRALFVFVQLPSSNAKELWEKWKEPLQGIKDKNGHRVISDAYLS
jgi:hypothetical protein